MAMMTPRSSQDADFSAESDHGIHQSRPAEPSLDGQREFPQILWDTYSVLVIFLLFGLGIIYFLPSISEAYVTIGILVAAWALIKDLPVQHETEATEPINTVPDFEYATLQPGCIRLLRLLRCECPFICCEIVTTTLVETGGPKFTALSYTWESQAPYRPVRICGRSFEVTPNVEAFLRAAQRAHMARRSEKENEQVDFLAANDLFWIDAVCINQADDNERGVQVSMMRKLYESAHSIAIWLGEPQTQTHLAFDFLRAAKPNTPAPEIPKKDKEAVTNGVIAIWEKPYWRRSWILQEATTPKAAGLKMIIMGNMKMTLSSLLETNLRDSLASVSKENSLRLEELHENVVMPLRTLIAARETRNGTHDADLHSLLQHVRRLHATDPRDKLFAPLQLAKEAGIYKSDYTLSEPDVYRQFGARLIAETRRLDLLAHIGARKAAVPDEQWPSWVPDWRESAAVPFPRRDLAEDTYTLWHFTRKDGGPDLSEKPPLSVRLQEDLDSGKLTVLAIRIGTIDKRVPIEDIERRRRRVFDVTRELTEQRALYDLKLNKKIEECFRKHSASPPTNLRVLAPEHATQGDALFCVFGARYPLVLRDLSSKPKIIDQVGRYLELHRSSGASSLSRSSEDLSGASATYTIVGEAICNQKSFRMSDWHFNLFKMEASWHSQNIGMKWLWGDRKLKFQWGLEKEHLRRVLSEKYKDPGVFMSQLICELSIG